MKTYEEWMATRPEIKLDAKGFLDRDSIADYKGWLESLPYLVLYRMVTTAQRAHYIRENPNAEVIETWPMRKRTK